MDITIQREALLKPLQAVNGVVEKKQTLPILANVLLSLLVSLCKYSSQIYKLIIYIL